MMSLDPAQLAALSAAVAEGTFDAAARRLHVTPSAVSQRIKALETATGRVLLTRGKPVTPTEAGQAVLRLARQVEALTADALHDVGVPGTGPATVPVAVNADSLATWFTGAFAALDDGVVLDLRSADQDRTADLLRSGTVMAAVTATARPVAGCDVTRLGRMVYRAAATPAFCRRWFADGVSAAALAAAPVVVYDRADDLQDAYLRRRARRSQWAQHPPRHHVPDSHAYVRAVTAGLGWGMIPDLQRVGTRLRDLEPGAGAVTVTLHWQQWRVPSAALEQVRRAVTGAARAALT